MRKEALKTMKIFKAYRPLLIGSVWRGTIRQGSDIDIALYHDVPNDILNLLKKNDVKTSKIGWTTVTKRGKPKASFHVYLPSGKQKVEIVVRNSEETNRKRKCEIFGDEIKGLNIQELERLLRKNPAQKFVPF
jgi:predicted nucleotidyltransferase